MAEDSFPFQFAPFSSTLEPNFWHQLSKQKLDIYGLDDEEKPLTAFYSNGYAKGIPCQINLDYSAFSDTPALPGNYYQALGNIKNFNTIDEFKISDKIGLLQEQGKKLWKDITEGEAIRNPSLLSRFYVITFADLKKYHYYYWFAFPALKEREDVNIIEPAGSISDRFTEIKISTLLNSYDVFKQQSRDNGFFIIIETADDLSVHALADFDSLYKDGDKVLFGVCDPCTLEKHPGWPLRNFLTLIAVHWATRLAEKIEVLCFRDRFKDGQRSIDHSIIFKLHVTPITDLEECPKCVGWEKNEKQNMGPRMVNLSATMDPSRLAESAVDLNLKLMRWRLLPELNLECISQTKCLLLGAGTLGCNVARCLLGWGVRTLTLVDNGKISYSNPVRQSLFMFEDSLHGGKSKAETAAKALQNIFPGVNSKGVTLNIPMPGHTISESIVAQTKKDVDLLEELIDNHDVVFLLMDTRESRWLPTLIGASKCKIVMNAALGFDTFLVLRHGVRVTESSMETDDASSSKKSLASTVLGRDLGCYFCNDVVAPGDSTRDRTLDQQCTVSRPGMSYIASALLVELLISVLTHPQKGDAAADTSGHDEHLTAEMLSPLGIVPHQIRGFLSKFHMVMPASRRFDKCTACSNIVLESYEKSGFEFLLNVFNQPKYLEDLTGLTQLHEDTQLSEVWELSDDEDY